MGIADVYEALARLLEYPEDTDTLLQSLWRIACYHEQCGLECPALPFTALLAELTLAELQEEYVAQFDFNPAKAPYLGHHLFGDTHGKGAYLVKVKQTYAEFGYTPEGKELPDHLSVLLNFLAHLSRLGQEDERRRFIEDTVLPGVQKLTGAGERSESPWLPVIRTTEILLNRDCGEAAP
ncbi:MAG TPA: nitrate reductase molybdenum cofactor assembly chaperone [Geomonas sp.]|nr:nitrate reductase molybdenum cofactor assembly chaperone [Geomonas sp.]